PTTPTTPQDMTAPVITLVADGEVASNKVDAWTAPLATAMDDVDGSVGVTVVYTSEDSNSNVSNLSSARAHLSVAGHRVKVIYTASDQAGNTAVQSAIFTGKAGVEGYSGRTYTSDEITKKDTPINPASSFDVTEMMPNHGTLGTYVTLKGQNFTEDFADFKVYFESSEQGKVEAQIVDYRVGEVVVISPVMEVAPYKVYVETGSTTSYKFDFAGEALTVEVASDSAKILVEDAKELIDSTIHEIQIAYTPELDAALSGDLIDELYDLKTELDGLMVELNQADPEVLQIFNQLMATEALVKQKADMDAVTELLSHSTASESLDNINTAIKTLKEVHSTLKTARTWMRNIGVAMIATGVIGSIFSFGGTTALITLGKSILSFCETVLTPIISTLTGIVFVLDCVPSYAVGDSFATQVVSENYGINEGFSSLREILGDRSSTNDLYETALKLRNSTIQLKSSIEGLYNPTEAFGINEALLDVVEDDAVLDAMYEDMKQSKADVEPLLALMDDYSLEADIDAYLAEINDYIESVENDPVTVYSNRDSYRHIFAASDDIIQDLEEVINEIESDGRLTTIGLGMGGIFEYTYSQNFRQWAGTIFENQIEDYDARNQIIENLYNENKEALVFEKIEILPAEIMDTDAGVLYVGRAMHIKGSMDFEGNTDTGLIVDEATGEITSNLSSPVTCGIEFMIGGFVSNFVDNIIGDIFDFDVNLSDVEVKLKLESEDESVISGYWDGDHLVVIGHKPGIAKVKVIADIEQVTGSNPKIPIESASITRTYVVLAGTQTEAPFSSGPRIDQITNLETMATSPLEIEAYLGDRLRVDGFGFSKDIDDHQNIYMPSIAGYNPLGLVEKRFTSNADYTSVEIEVPDTVTGDFYLSVGKDQDMTPTDIMDETYTSNHVTIKVKNNELHLAPPSAIVGETLTVKGKGFSHYGQNNQIEFLDMQNHNSRLGTAYPVIQAQSIAGLVMDTVNSTSGFGGAINCDFHEQLDFEMPDIPKDTTYDLVVNTLNNRFLSNGKSVMVRKFSDPISLDTETLRGDIAVNAINDDLLSVYMDVSDLGGFMLMGAYADGMTGVVKEVNEISRNIGGLESVPDEPSVDYQAGFYGTTWIGKDVDQFDDVFVAFSANGKTWTTEMNISNSSNVSSQPRIKMMDMDGDGDGDAIVAYMENGDDESDNTSIKVAIMENDAGDYKLRMLKSISLEDACAPAIDGIDNHVIISYSEAPSMHSGSVYERQIEAYEADIDQFDFVNDRRYQVSSLTGKVDYFDYGVGNGKDMMLYVTANNPDVALHKENDVYKAYYVWEQTGTEHKSNWGIDVFKPESVYYAQFTDGVQTVDGKNISSITRQCQDPKVAVDEDGVVSVAFINLGVAEQSYDPQEIKSYVYFTRSMDEGANFAKPYMQLEDNDQRIGHLNLVAYDSGKNTLIYQKHDNQDRPTVTLVS
ncbi:MAG: hypothetical protein JXO44_07415, partial [Clostridia bacterium]|nr:hypothetical protein [Clostridia bacterium]